jgi:hypothetical protein
MGMLHLDLRAAVAVAAADDNVWEPVCLAALVRA